MTLTEQLARTALELHRLASAAREVKNLKSPATPVEKNVKGAADPTASTALDERRKRVSEALRIADMAAQTLIADAYSLAINPLRDALAEWEGKK